MTHFGRTNLLRLALAGTLLAGCAENTYLYRPAQQATARVSGLPAARYGIPPEKPQGEVLVVSTGVTEIKPDAKTPARALFARVIVTNNSDEASWQLDTRKQAVAFGNDRVAPKYVNTFGQPLPIVEIPKGEKRTIDFYFPVPANVETNGDLPQFDLSWNIDTGTRPIAERTSFDRYKVEPYPYYGYPYGYPYGPYPYGPYYGWGGYGPHPYWGASVYYGGGYYGGGGHYHGGGGGYHGGGDFRGGGGYSRPSVSPR